MVVKVIPKISSRVNGYTTRQLEAYINRHRWDQEKVSLEETGAGVFWQGKPVSCRRFPVYMAPEDPRRKVSFVRKTEGDACTCDFTAKQVWLPYGCYYRSPGTKEKWIAPEIPGYITLCDASDWVEMLKINEGQAALERYELTADPVEEDVFAQEFKYVRHLGELTITGVRHYCERLHIPARLGGLPVANVCLPTGVDAPYLRELSVEEGVRKLDFAFGHPELEKIRIPDSVQLVRSPEGIRHTLWFRNRPDGPVYFHGYYCGTKGEPETAQLTIREGTVGVTRWADEQISWKKISLPDSLAYISSGAFGVDAGLEEVKCAGESAQLRAFFRTRYPFLINTLRKQRRHGGFERLPQPLTGKLLYELGRSSTLVRQQIPWEWLPTAPRLRYEDGGWIAEFWYCAQNGVRPGWYAAFHLPSGKPVEVRQLTRNAWVPFSSFWTDGYQPPEYLMAEDYLNCCAAAVHGGEPTEAILEQLNAWWEELTDRKILRSLERNDDWAYAED